MPRAEFSPLDKTLRGRSSPAATAAAPAREFAPPPSGRPDCFDPNFMTSLARGLAVIQAFSDGKRPLTNSQLSGKTGLSRAAVRRYLYILMKLGFAASDGSRHFCLRPRILVCTQTVP